PDSQRRIPRGIAEADRPPICAVPVDPCLDGGRATLCGVEPVELEAPGLRLRPWRADDAPAVLAALRDPAIARWNPVDQPDPDLATAQAWVRDRGDWTSSEHASFAVTVAADGTLVGSVSLFKIDRVHHNAEIG